MLDIKKLYTSKELQDALDVNKGTLESMRREGLPYIKRGKKRWWLGASIIEWLDEKYATDVFKEIEKQKLR